MRGSAAPRYAAFPPEVQTPTDKRRVEISATITEAIAKALENERDLPKEVSDVARRDIAGGIRTRDLRVIGSKGGRLASEFRIPERFTPSETPSVSLELERIGLSGQASTIEA